MVNAFSESAVAIFITSFTDVLSFAIGCFTDIIAVRGFCAMTSASMFFTFLYQVFHFTLSAFSVFFFLIFSFAYMKYELIINAATQAFSQLNLIL